MAELSGKPEVDITVELSGVIFQNPLTDRWETSDEYLSGNVREKLQVESVDLENQVIMLKKPEEETMGITVR